MKDKRAVRTVQAEEDAISSGMIAKIIEESMRVFWEFLRADHKVEGKTILNVPQKNHVNLQNGADLTLLMDIRADLQKVYCFLNFLIPTLIFGLDRALNILLGLKQKF